MGCQSRNIFRMLHDLTSFVRIHLVFWCNLWTISICHRLFRNFRSLTFYPRKYVRIHLTLCCNLSVIWNNRSKIGPESVTPETTENPSCILVYFIGGYLSSFVSERGPRNIFSIIHSSSWFWYEIHFHFLSTISLRVLDPLCLCHCLLYRFYWGYINLYNYLRSTSK